MRSSSELVMGDQTDGNCLSATMAHTDNGNNEWLSLFPDNSDDDEHDSVAAQRQERIRKAFELSKESYKSEPIVLSPFFFRVEPADVATVANNDRHGLQNLGMLRYAPFPARV